jgi:hypothetical protein
VVGPGSTDPAVAVRRSACTLKHHKQSTTWAFGWSAKTGPDRKPRTRRVRPPLPERALARAHCHRPATSARQSGQRFSTRLF